MSFNDLGKKDAAPHVDTPVEAEARAQAAADLKAKAARAAAQREGKRDAATPSPAAKPDKSDKR